MNSGRLAAATQHNTHFVKTNKINERKEKLTKWKKQFNLVDENLQWVV